MTPEEKHLENVNKGMEILGIKKEKKTRKPKPANPYDFRNTTPCHNFEPFLK